MNYQRQKDTLERLKKKHPDRAGVLIDAIETIERAEKLEEWLKQIYECAKKEREFCLHCNTIANLIEELK